MAKKKTSQSRRMKTSFLIAPTVWLEFTSELRRKGLDYGEGVEMLAKQFLAKGSDVTALKREVRNLEDTPVTRDEMHRMLDEIMDAGAFHMGAIYANLEMAWGSARDKKSMSREEMRTMRRAVWDTEDAKKNR